MPRHKSPPKYGHHRPFGQARTIINGRQIYLGKFGSPESKAAYARIIAERVSADRVVVEPPLNGVAVGLTLDEVLLRYWRFPAKLC